MVGLPFQDDIILLSKMHEPWALQPPEVISTLNIPRDEEDSDWHAKFTRQFVGVSIVIVIAVVKGQHKGRPVASSFALSWRCKEFFEGLVKMEHAIVPTQVEQVPTQIPPTCTMIVEYNQAGFAGTLLPPACKAYQPTIIEEAGHKYSYQPAHRQPSSKRTILLVGDDSMLIL